MKEIIFPTIGLNLRINPIAVSILGKDIYWYAIFIVVAIGIGLFLCKKDDGKYNVKYDDILLLILIIIPVSIICARLYYVLFSLEHYINNPLKILNIRDGGLAIYGGIIGGSISIYIYSKFKKINFLDLLDYIIPFLAFANIGLSSGKKGSVRNKKTDWFYGTDEYERNLDDRADKNQYKF